MKKTLRIITLAALTTGLALWALTGWLYISDRDFWQSARKTTGTVIDLIPEYRSRSSDPARTGLSAGAGEITYSNRTDTLWRARVRFTDNKGQIREFTDRTAANPPLYDRGQQVVVLYDPKNPLNARVDGGFKYLPSVVTGFIGTAFLLPGLIMLGVLVKGSSRRRLRENGQRIEATVVDIERNGRIEVNGRSPWVLRAHWKHPASGQTLLFESENLWINPEPFLGRKTVTVFLDPRNPKRYWVDTSFLPQNA
ncbi:MAG: DUF3592 domain-containing protein [Gammaproteobacteria bacterium]|nr:MAG: DUF3592 domain-containing protein [Gammaproteobacteria bacterium]